MKVIPEKRREKINDRLLRKISQTIRGETVL